MDACTQRIKLSTAQATVLANTIILVARNALKRKKQHEHSLEQTNGQISMLEQQIYSIESANINQETLLAMKNAGAAMKQIHGKMKMEDVDVTMYVLSRFLDATCCLYHTFQRPIHPTLSPSTLSKPSHCN